MQTHHHTQQQVHVEDKAVDLNGKGKKLSEPCHFTYTIHHTSYTIHDMQLTWVRYPTMGMDCRMTMYSALTASKMVMVVSTLAVPSNQKVRELRRMSRSRGRIRLKWNRDDWGTGLERMVYGV
ncbi:hypothetical protein EON63_14790 [archaeon]|nr:MAG: hypothetical protein EON63_14790 [archaeon]